MLLDWLHGDLHHWAIFCCTVATLGLVGAFWVALAAAGGKGVFAFLNGSRQPTVIVVNGGTYTPPPRRRTWGFGRIWLLCAAIFSGGPMLTLLILGVNAAVGSVLSWLAANWWVFPLTAVAVVLLGAFWWLIRHDRKREADQWSELAALPSVVEVPKPIWQAPQVEGNWAERP